MEPNKTADKFSISLHPQIESEYILTENATGGILKTGNRDEIIAFCKDNLAASVNIPELEEMLDTAEVYTNNETSCPIVEENRDTYSITRSYDGVSIEVRLTAAELEDAFRIQELNYLREDVVNFLESEDCGFTVSDFGKDGIREIALLFRDTTSLYGRTHGSILLRFIHRVPILSHNSMTPFYLHLAIKMFATYTADA